MAFEFLEQLMIDTILIKALEALWISGTTYDWHYFDKTNSNWKIWIKRYSYDSAGEPRN